MDSSSEQEIRPGFLKLYDYKTTLTRDGEKIVVDPEDRPRYNEIYSEHHIRKGGGMGQIVPMRDEKTGRIVAAKFTDSSISTFEEARINANFNHPNIVTVYDYAISKENTDYLNNPEVYAILDWVEGETLVDWFKETHDLGEIAKVFDQVASALSYIHRKGYVYADLKPGNLLFDHHRNVELVDYGTTVKMDEEGLARGTSTHSPSYSAPEQRAMAYLSAGTDIYLFANLLFEVLTDKHGAELRYSRDEFAYDSQGPLPIRGEYRELFDDQALKELSRVVRLGLAKVKEERQESIEEINGDVQKILKSLE